MSRPALDSQHASTGIAEIALMVVDHVPAMLAYWDSNLRCRFANNAYRDWFGKGREDILGTHIKDLLGPLYELNLPYIQGALRGERQVFERAIPLPDGSIRNSIATYTPDVHDGIVRGFTAHVADVTRMKTLEASLRESNRELQESLDQVRELRSILPICAYCKSIRTDENYWQRVETYIRRFTAAELSHGICPECYEKVERDFGLADSPKG